MSLSLVPFDKPYLRHLLTTHKDFLKNLYASKSVKRTRGLIENATKVQLNVLLRILYLICNGAIPLPTAVGKKIPKAILRKFRIFRRHYSMTHIFHANHPIEETQKVLLQFSHYVGLMLTPLFENV